MNVVFYFFWIPSPRGYVDPSVFPLESLLSYCWTLHISQLNKVKAGCVKGETLCFFLSNSICMLKGNSLAEREEFLMQISLSAVDKIITQQLSTAVLTISKFRVIFSPFEFELLHFTCPSQWNISRQGGSRDLKCGNMIGLALLSSCLLPGEQAIGPRRIRAVWSWPGTNLQLEAESSLHRSSPRWPTVVWIRNKSCCVALSFGVVLQHF